MNSAYLPGLFNSFVSFPTVCVGPTMRVSVLVRQIRQHRVKNSRVYRCRCLSKTESKEAQFDQTVPNLHIQVDRSGLALQGSLSARHLQLEAKHV